MFLRKYFCQPFWTIPLGLAVGLGGCGGSDFDDGPTGSGGASGSAGQAGGGAAGAGGGATGGSAGAGGTAGTGGGGAGGGATGGFAGTGGSAGSGYVPPAGLSQVYVSPSGTDTGACQSAAPCLTFQYAVSKMKAGDALVLKDGSYPLATHGALNPVTGNGQPIPKSGLVPGGASAQLPTVVRAENPGKVDVEGGLRLGVISQVVDHVVVHGITFHAGGRIYNGNHNLIKDCGFEGGVGIGTIDHSQGNTHNLIEDGWTWGKNVRAQGSNYRAHHNTWRRVLVRPDGCDQKNCGQKAGNYLAGVTVYNSHHTTLENVIVMDRILGSANQTEGYADFSTAQHDSNQPAQPEGEANGNNAWLGCMAVNSEDPALVFEADAVTNGTTATIKEFVALKTRAGLALDPAHRPYSGNSHFVVDGVQGYPTSGPTLTVGCDVVQSGDPGCSHSINNVKKSTYQSGAASAALPKDRYGTTTPMWPWPNEDRIKSELCAATTRGLCAQGGSLSTYLQSF